MHQCTTCVLLLIESLPKGLFVDLYQAVAAVQFGGPQVTYVQEIKTELVIDKMIMKVEIFSFTMIAFLF